MPEARRKLRGARLSAARERAGLSQLFVAEQLQCSRQLVGNIEKTGKLSVDQLECLCLLYGCSPNSIVFSTPADEAATDTFAEEVAKLPESVRDRLWMFYQVFLRRGVQPPISRAPATPKRAATEPGTGP